MKSINLINVLVIMLFTLSSCNSKKSKPNIAKNQVEICSDYSDKEMSTLPYDLVRDIVNNYRDHQHKMIADSYRNEYSSTFNDARSIWFDLETLKSFIYHIEKLTIENGVARNSNDLGIRIYYATYPPKNGMNREGLKEFLTSEHLMKYEKKHTLVMIPTIKKSKRLRNKEYTFNVDYLPGNTSSYKLAADLSMVSNVVHQDTVYALSPYISTGSNGDIPSQNHGGLFPPDDLKELGIPNLNKTIMHFIE